MPGPVESPAEPASHVSRRVAWAAIGAAGAVIIGAVVVGVGLLDRPQSEQGSGSLVGPHWRLQSVSHGGSRTEIPSLVGAFVELSPYGTLTARDGVNRIAASYTVAGDGFTVRSSSSTQLGYAGADPAVIAAVDGIDTVLIRPGDGAPVTARATPTASTLVLDGGGYQLTFTNSATTLSAQMLRLAERVAGHRMTAAGRAIAVEATFESVKDVMFARNQAFDGAQPQYAGHRILIVEGNQPSGEMMPQGTYVGTAAPRMVVVGGVQDFVDEQSGAVIWSNDWAQGSSDQLDLKAFGDVVEFDVPDTSVTGPGGPR